MCYNYFMEIKRIEPISKIPSKFPSKVPDENVLSEKKKLPEELPVDIVNISDEAQEILRREKQISVEELNYVLQNFQ